MIISQTQKATQLAYNNASPRKPNTTPSTCVTRPTPPRLASPFEVDSGFALFPFASEVVAEDGLESLPVVIRVTAAVPNISSSAVERDTAVAVISYEPMVNEGAVKAGIGNVLPSITIAFPEPAREMAVPEIVIAGAPRLNVWLPTM